jgi:hypothetical protein
MDEYSRFMFECQGLHSTNHDATKEVFKRVFKEYGLPSSPLKNSFVTRMSGFFSDEARAPRWPKSWLAVTLRSSRVENDVGGKTSHPQ